MVEEARLESVYTGNRIEGSNPSVSAYELYIILFSINCRLINDVGRNKGSNFLPFSVRYYKLQEP